MSDDAGSNACWLANVCPECGAFIDDPAVLCWRCGLVVGEDGEDSTPPSARQRP